MNNKYRNIVDQLFVSLSMGLQKIHNEIKTFKIDNSIIKIKEIEHKKILYYIEKLIPRKELILNLSFKIIKYNLCYTKVNIIRY